MTMPRREAELIPDEDSDRSYDAEPAFTRLATEEARVRRVSQEAYPSQPGR